METDFRKVLKELRAEEKRLDDELLVIRKTIPGIELMASKMAPEAGARATRYASMGTREAILNLLTEEHTNSLTRDQISETLLAGGIRTTATDFAGSVSTTLSQLRASGHVDRVEDRWKIRVVHLSEMIPNVLQPLSSQ
jgi:hypothetical protein